MVVKWPIIPTIDQGPISRLAQEYETVVRVQGPRKRKGKGQEKIRLCACAKLTYCTVLYLILGKSIFLAKNSFVSKTKAHLASWRPKN